MISTGTPTPGNTGHLQSTRAEGWDFSPALADAKKVAGTSPSFVARRCGVAFALGSARLVWPYRGVSQPAISCNQQSPCKTLTQQIASIHGEIPTGKKLQVLQVLHVPHGTGLSRYCIYRLGAVNEELIMSAACTY